MPSKNLDNIMKDSLETSKNSLKEIDRQALKKLDKATLKNELNAIKIQGVDIKDIVIAIGKNGESFSNGGVAADYLEKNGVNVNEKVIKIGQKSEAMILIQSFLEANGQKLTHFGADGWMGGEVQGAAYRYAHPEVKNTSTQPIAPKAPEKTKLPDVINNQLRLNIKTSIDGQLFLEKDHPELKYLYSFMKDKGCVNTTGTLVNYLIDTSNKTLVIREQKKLQAIVTIPLDEILQDKLGNIRDNFEELVLERMKDGYLNTQKAKIKEREDEYTKVTKDTTTSLKVKANKINTLSIESISLINALKNNKEAKFVTLVNTLSTNLKKYNEAYRGYIKADITQQIDIYSKKPLYTYENLPLHNKISYHQRQIEGLNKILARIVKSSGIYNKTDKESIINLVQKKIEFRENMIRFETVKQNDLDNIRLFEEYLETKKLVPEIQKDRDSFNRFVAEFSGRIYNDLFYKKNISKEAYSEQIKRINAISKSYNGIETNLAKTIE